MAFTGDLELLNIVDIIQLLNSTRKSGTFSVVGPRGESRILFSNGYIVGASHLNNRVRIGTVLVKMNVITPEDLELALEAQKHAGKDRKPLIVTLMELGKLGRDDAARGLKKLIELTLVELINWTKGTFTLDTEAIAVSPECSYPISKMEQEIGLDAQMVLMDVLRIVDERERDRLAGKTVPSDEDVFADVVPVETSGEVAQDGTVITADDLGLGDLDHLERKIPQYVQATEVFDPVEIHRKKIQEILAAYPADAQEAFVAFLERHITHGGGYDASHRPKGRTKALILFGEDELIRHSVMTICKDEGVLVFTTDGEEELDRIIAQCLKIDVSPIAVFDTPGAEERLLSQEKVVGLRRQVRERYPEVPVIQIASSQDYPFVLESYRDGVRAVFPRPSAEHGQATFIEDTIAFLETFTSYVSGLSLEQPEQKEAPAPAAADIDDLSSGQEKPVVTDGQMSLLRQRVLSLRGLQEPSAVSLALLQSVSELCERAVTFIVRSSELVGEKALGVHSEKDAGPTSAAQLKIPLAVPSVFREAVETGRFFCGESHDEILKKHLFEEIGAPLSPVIVLIPMKSCGKILTITYGDFGRKEASPVSGEALEILAQAAGLMVESVLYRKQFSKASQK
jgi:DNA-binding NarL/FixJ family response regulator